MKTPLAALLIIFSTILYAQVPQSFKYQAVARNVNGDLLVNQQISVRISIIDSAVGGANVYSEIHKEGTNDYGLFWINIGEGINQTGQFSNIAWLTGNKWIKIELDIAGGTNYADMGMSPLLSVPYALFAGNGGGNTGPWLYNGDSIYYNNGNVGIGTMSPTQKLEITGGGIRINGTAGIGFNSETPEAHPTPKISEGVRMYYDGGSLLGGSNDGLVIEKTDDNETGPDGGIAFVNQGHTGGRVISLAIRGNGLVGIGNLPTPNSRLEIADGDVYVNNSDYGIILKSPNGNCWRVTIDNNGDFDRTNITCPLYPY